MKRRTRHGVTRCGYVPRWQHFTCNVCGRSHCWCTGGHDDMPGACDYCWAKAHKGDASP
jgi:hypothetical protein